MKPIRFNIMRNMRIQLKTGFMKEVPEEFEFMKRYPPLTRTTDEPYHETKVETIPYVKLYKKIVARNPIYVDERVHSAYWMHEPEALVFAKKQYELMQQGLEEEEAYQKAEAYVAGLENAAFQEMKKVTNSIKQEGLNSSWLKDPSIAEELQRWRNRAKEVDVQFLDDQEWGELTFFIHDKVLKWNEVDRERRMKDVPFVNQFDTIVKTLFGDRTEINSDKLYTRLKKDLLERLKFKNHIAKPFHVEDYIQHFQKLKNEPDVRKWSAEERTIFSLWIVDVLTYKHLIAPEDVVSMEKYLKTTRSLFFPMMAFPHRAKEFEVPTVDQIKRLLYDNSVGYKKATNGNTYVRRFYRLPRLLFPAAVDEMEKLLAEAEEAEVQKKRDEVEKRLKAKKEANRAISGDEDDEFSLSDDDDEEEARSNRYDDDEDEYDDDDENDIEKYKDAVQVVKERHDTYERPFKRIPDPEVREEVTKKQQSVVKTRSTSKLDELMRSTLKYKDEEEEEEEDQEDDESGLEGDKHLYYPKVVEEVVHPITDDEQWRKTFAKYYRYPETELERERENHFRALEAEAPETAQNEDEMQEFRNYRMTNVVMSRTRLAKQFNDREAARKVADWKRRGVYMNKFNFTGPIRDY